MANQMINILALLATEKLQPNKANFATFKVLIEEHAASKGVTGYLDGTITKPPLITGTTDIPAPTPIFSTNPSRDEWTYRDGATKSMVECWDSVESICAKKSDAALSHAQSELQSIKFTGTSRDDLDALLANVRNKANTVRMMGGTVEEKELKNVLIRSLPADPRWLGLQAALFSATDVDDAFAITTGMPEHTTVVSSLTALNTSTQRRQCTNPSCKAKNKSSHTFENCYWPGGGKEGQFPANFRRNRPQANQATAPADTPAVHRVLMVRIAPEDLAVHIPLPPVTPEEMARLAPLPRAMVEEVEDDDPLLPKAGSHLVPLGPLGPLLRSISDIGEDEDEAPVENEESLLPPPIANEHVEHVFHAPASPTAFMH
ncbi:hypothetical protein K438DRAFT_1969969 [Mycena galopus ATCC 62051]|nr:hypothetical protein K438DRAFT_1969969 [Mycena galopus ATCC 62051]